MSGQAVFEQIVATATDGWGQVHKSISQEDYDQWKKDYIWEALHGMRYGQSFCNHFSIKDNHLFYAPGNITWCDDYIQKHYIERIRV